ncbi:MAG: WYL domain-containing protein [Bacteroidia bacterium]|nr:WYL domain-containing protein [Bacteroidia bacterium]
MPVNRNALIRYKTIDQCLQNRYRSWTLQDLIDACSDALYEYEGIDKGVSRRTVQADIQVMRSDKLGYNAPIIVKDKKFYTYEDAEYSITNIPLSEQDLEMLTEAVEFMKQFQGFSHFRELGGMVQKLEDHIYSHKTDTKPVIDFEKNENLKGIEYLDPLYQAIIKKKSIKVEYKSFRARNPQGFIFYPYLLKEFRNRWFLVGRRKNQGGILNLALDRIIAVEESEELYREDKEFDASTYFKHAIGVSVSPNLETEEIQLFVNHTHAPYVLTKPLHPSQELVDKDNYGIIISLEVQHNFELEKEILAFGDGIKVIKPERLKRKIKDRLKGAIDLYDTEINESGLVAASRKLSHRGFCDLNFVFTQRIIRKIKGILDSEWKDLPKRPYSQRCFLQKHPRLKEFIFNPNLRRIIEKIDPNAFIVKAIYFDKTPQSNWFVSWHQDLPINVKEKIETPGFENWTFKEEIHSVQPPLDLSKNIFSIRIHLDDTDANNGALQVIPGSHNKRLSDEEIKVISSNSIPSLGELAAGGIQIIKPLILHASSKSKSQKRRRVIHIDFASMELPGELEWLEKDVF